MVKNISGNFKEGDWVDFHESSTGNRKGLERYKKLSHGEAKKYNSDLLENKPVPSIVESKEVLKYYSRKRLECLDKAYDYNDAAEKYEEIVNSLS